MKHMESRRSKEFSRVKWRRRRMRRTDGGGGGGGRSVRTKVKKLQRLIPGAKGLKLDRLFLRIAVSKKIYLQALSKIYQPSMMETLNLRSRTSQAKSVGTIVSIVVAIIVTFCKGPSLLMAPSHSSSPHLLLGQQSNWVIGGFLLVADCVFASAWLIVQASVVKKFPAELFLVFYYCFFVTLQLGIICLVMEGDLSAWSFKPDVRLVAVVYSAVFGSLFQLCVSTWCIHRTGPVFVAMFKPLGIVLSVVIGVIFLGDTFYLGSLIGAIVIVTGFYSVM